MALSSSLDQIGRQIVALLLKDGRMSSAAMARCIGTSQRTVRYHLDRLTASGMIWIGAVVSPQAIGLTSLRMSF